MVWNEARQQHKELTDLITMYYCSMIERLAALFHCKAHLHLQGTQDSIVPLT